MPRRKTITVDSKTFGRHWVLTISGYDKSLREDLAVSVKDLAKVHGLAIVSGQDPFAPMPSGKVEPEPAL